MLMAKLAGVGLTSSRPSSPASARPTTSPAVPAAYGGVASLAYDLPDLLPRASYFF